MKTLHLAVALVAAGAGLATADISSYPNCAVSISPEERG